MLVFDARCFRITVWNVQVVYEHRVGQMSGSVGPQAKMLWKCVLYSTPPQLSGRCGWTDVSSGSWFGSPIQVRIQTSVPRLTSLIGGGSNTQNVSIVSHMVSVLQTWGVVSRWFGFLKQRIECKLPLMDVDEDPLWFLIWTNWWRWRWLRIGLHSSFYLHIYDYNAERRICYRSIGLIMCN